MNRCTDILDGHQFDLLVCGGGIYGAWTAYDAALRGLRVMIVDKGDWASGTSSASSKLIHGGLRYLQSFELNLVKKSLSEREMFFHIAPHRVRPLRFGIPIYTSSPVGRIGFRVGLWLYDLLAGTSIVPLKHDWINVADFSKDFPFLDTTGLRGGFDYMDGQTDDARFTLEIIDGARKNGSACRNYCEVIRFFKSKEKKIEAAELRDNVSGKTFNVKCRSAVNVSGQWIDSMLGHSRPLFRLSKGVHLMLPNLGLTSALLLFSRSDSRVFFMIPWYGQTLLGTTDDDYNGDIENVRAEEADIDYLLNAANTYFKSKVWTRNDILGSFAGLRVLKNSGSAKPYSISRDWNLDVRNDGLSVSVGGKFTSARQDAAVIVDYICQRLSLQRDCQTKWLRFPWAPGPGFKDWRATIEKTGSRLGLDKDVCEWLVFRHGNRVEEIFQLVERETALSKKVFPELPFIFGDLVFCLRHEMVVHLEDLLRRRLPVLILRRMTAEEVQRIAETAAKELHWDNTRMAKEVASVTRKWKIR